MLAEMFITSKFDHVLSPRWFTRSILVSEDYWVDTAFIHVSNFEIRKRGPTKRETYLQTFELMKAWRFDFLANTKYGGFESEHISQVVGDTDERTSVKSFLSVYEDKE